jgi:hypothetical protein
MSKIKYTEEQLKEKAKELFKVHKKEKAFHACQDGTFYPEKKVRSADDHNQQFVHGKVFRIERSEAGSQKSEDEAKKEAEAKAKKEAEEKAAAEAKAKPSSAKASEGKGK